MSGHFYGLFIVATIVSYSMFLLFNFSDKNILQIGEDEVSFFSAKHWDHRNRAEIFESTTHCHEGPYSTKYQSHST